MGAAEKEILSKPAEPNPPPFLAVRTPKKTKIIEQNEKPKIIEQNYKFS